MDTRVPHLNTLLFSSLSSQLHYNPFSKQDTASKNPAISKNYALKLHKPTANMYLQIRGTYPPPYAPYTPTGQTQEELDAAQRIQHRRNVTNLLLLIFFIVCISTAIAYMVTSPTLRKRRERHQQNQTQTPLEPILTNSNSYERPQSTRPWPKPPGASTEAWISPSVPLNTHPRAQAQTERRSPVNPTVPVPGPAVLPGGRKPSWNEPPPTYEARVEDRHVPEAAGPPIYEWESGVYANVREVESANVVGQRRGVEWAGRNMG